MSTGTIRIATSRTHVTASKNWRNHQPASVTAKNFVKLAATSAPNNVRTTVTTARATTASASCDDESAERSGRARYGIANVAGMTSSETIAICHQRDGLGRSSATAS